MPCGAKSQLQLRSKSMQLFSDSSLQSIWECQKEFLPISSQIASPTARPESSELSFQTLGHAWHPICIVIVIALHYNSFKVSGTSNPEHAGRYPYSLHPKKPSEDTAPAMNYRALG